MQQRATERASEARTSAGASGPDAAFAQIVREHEQRVRRVLRCRGVAERDLPDAQQEVFLVVHRKLAQFEGRSSLATWLHRIALNVASEHRRRARHRYEQLIDGARPEPGGGDPHAALEARDALAHAASALAVLSDEQRDAFLLHEIAGLSMHEVAAQLQVPLKTAFSRLYAARRTLAAALGRRGVILPWPGAALVAWFGAHWLRRSPAHAHAGVATPPATALSLQVAALALACSVLPAAVEPAARPAVLADARPAEQPARWVRNTTISRAVDPTASERGSHATGASTAAAEAAPIREPRRLARAPGPDGRNRVQPSDPPPELPSSVESVEFESGQALADAFTVTRAGALDVRPRLAHPLSERVATTPRTAPRIRLRGPRDAADAVEQSL